MAVRQISGADGKIRVVKKYWSGFVVASLVSTFLIALPIQTANAGTSSLFGRTGAQPLGITVDSSGNVYVANSSIGQNSLTKITSAGETSTISSVGTQTYDVTVDSSGNVYSANRLQNSVTKITPTGNKSYFCGTGSNPKLITIDSDGNIYTINDALYNVTKCLATGGSNTYGSMSTSPQGIVVDSAGNVYTAEAVLGQVTKIASSGTTTKFANTGSSPVDLAIDSAGNIYAANYGSNTVTRITPAGVSTKFGDTGSQPYSITIDSAGNVYTANYGDRSVTKITQSGESFRIGTTDLQPRGIAVDSDSNVYVSNFASNTVTKIVQYSAPAFTITSSEETATAKSPISGYTINSTGGTIARFSISPSIGNGLSFSTSTGRITGTPSSQASLLIYTITGANESGSDSATFTLTVNPGPPSNDSGPPPPPPPPKSYFLQASPPTLRKIGNLVACYPGTYSYRIQYFDGKQEFSEANTRLSSRTYSFLIEGRVQSSLTAPYSEDSATVTLNSFTGTGLITCLVVAVKDGLSVTGYSSENTTNLTVPLRERYSRINTAAAKYEAALIQNSQKVQVGLKENR